MVALRLIMDGDTGTEATRAIPQMFRGTTPVSDLAIFRGHLLQG